MYLGSSVIEVEACNLHEVKKDFAPAFFFPLLTLHRMLVDQTVKFSGLGARDKLQGN